MLPLESVECKTAAASWLRFLQAHETRSLRSPGRVNGCHVGRAIKGGEAEEGVGKLEGRKDTGDERGGIGESVVLEGEDDRVPLMIN